MMWNFINFDKAATKPKFLFQLPVEDTRYEKKVLYSSNRSPTSQKSSKVAKLKGFRILSY